jgi:glycosyltransferase involved in cell wall biosynthesis
MTSAPLPGNRAPRGAHAGRPVSGTGAGVSVLILTKNEELDLPGCLDTLTWCDDIHVLDSGSTDKTQQIAAARGANVHVREFDGYASQRNFGLALPYKHSWVLVLDADERLPPPAGEEVQAFVKDANSSCSAARLRRRDIWWGRWLRHAQISPYYVRLLRVRHCKYEREINETLIVSGEIADLKECFDHYPFSKGLAHWISKHNQYSSMEARIVYDGDKQPPSLRTALLSRDFNERRRAQKAIFYKLPGRPVIKLIYMVLVRRAFLDGLPGLRYAILQAIYEYFIVLKTKEMRQTGDRKPKIPL